MIHKFDGKGGNFAIIPDGLYLDSRLSLTEIRIMVCLLGKPSDWSVSPSHLASALNVTRRGVLKALNNLAGFGYIRITGNEKNGVITSRRYEVFYEPQNTAETPKREPQFSKSVNHSSQKVRTPVHPTSNTTSTSTSTTSSSASVNSGSRLPEQALETTSPATNSAVELSEQISRLW